MQPELQSKPAESKPTFSVTAHCNSSQLWFPAEPICREPLRPSCHTGVHASRFSNVQSWKMSVSSLLSTSLCYNLLLANNQYLKIMYLHFYTLINATICKHCLNIYLISQWQQLTKLIRTCWGCGTVGHYSPGVCKTLDSIRSIQKLTHAWTVQKERGLCFPPIMRVILLNGAVYSSVFFFPTESNETTWILSKWRESVHCGGLHVLIEEEFLYVLSCF